MDIFELSKNCVADTIYEHVWVYVWIREEVIFLKRPDLCSPMIVVWGWLLAILRCFLVTWFGIVFEVRDALAYFHEEVSGTVMMSFAAACHADALVCVCRHSGWWPVALVKLTSWFEIPISWRLISRIIYYFSWSIISRWIIFFCRVVLVLIRYLINIRWIYTFIGWHLG